MKHLPHDATDEDLLEFVDGWVRLMEAEDYERAFAYTAHTPEMHWSAELLRQVIKSYDECKPTQHVTLLGQPTDVHQRKEVYRYPSPRAAGIGYVWYDLNIDGVVSDITATFDVRREEEGLVVVLNDVHVM